MCQEGRSGCVAALCFHIRTVPEGSSLFARASDCNLVSRPSNKGARGHVGDWEETGGALLLWLSGPRVTGVKWCRVKEVSAWGGSRWISGRNPVWAGDFLTCRRQQDHCVTVVGLSELPAASKELKLPACCPRV